MQLNIIIIILYRQDGMCYYWDDKRDLVNHNNKIITLLVQYVCSVVISQSIIFCDIYVILCTYIVCMYSLILFEPTMCMRVYSSYYYGA